MGFNIESEIRIDRLLAGFIGLLKRHYRCTIEDSGPSSVFTVSDHGSDNKTRSYISIEKAIPHGFHQAVALLEQGNSNTIGTPHCGRFPRDYGVVFGRRAPSCKRRL